MNFWNARQTEERFTVLICLRTISQFRLVYPYPKTMLTFSRRELFDDSVSSKERMRQNCIFCSLHSFDDSVSSKERMRVRFEEAQDIMTLKNQLFLVFAYFQIMIKKTLKSKLSYFHFPKNAGSTGSNSKGCESFRIIRNSPKKMPETIFNNFSEKWFCPRLILFGCIFKKKSYS